MILHYVRERLASTTTLNGAKLMINRMQYNFKVQEAGNTRKQILYGLEMCDLKLPFEIISVLPCLQRLRQKLKIMWNILNILRRYDKLFTEEEPGIPMNELR